ncbi:MAG: alpha/beta hydrolase [Bacteroidota bacterium]
MDTITRIEYLQSSFNDPIKEAPPKFPFYLKFIQLGFKTIGRLFPRKAAEVAYRLFSTPRTRARHKTSDPILESARLFEVLYGKILLKGYEWGSSEKTILLVHGWESRGTALRTFVPELVAKGYRVIAMDGPAHGNSGGKQTNLPHFAGAIRAFMNYNGNVKGIIAHSFGGASTVYALAELDLSLRLEKLVLVGVPNRLRKVISNSLRTLGVQGQPAKYFRQIINNKLKSDIDSVNVEDAYPQIRVEEALIVHDKRDAVVPFSSAQAINEAWKNSTLLVVDGYGHYRLMKNPDVIKRVVTFMG